MAAPETQFQQAGLNIPYNYSPVETRLNPPIQLQGTGQLWAKVGETALNAAGQLSDQAKMLQQSPLNPAVAAAQDYAVTQYDTAADRINELAATRAGRMTMGTGAAGLETVPAARTDIDSMVRMALRSAPATSESRKTTQTGNGDGSAPTPQTVVEAPDSGYGASAAVVGAAPPAPSGSTTTQPKTKTHTTGDELTDNRGASTDDDFLLRRMMQQRGGSDAAQQGTPASMTFLNPATGNIEPLQTPSVFAAKPTAPAPAAPDGSQPAQPAQGGSPAAATKADQVAMQQWQNQNAHPVMSSQDALAWMKTQTTLAQDATYLPMGGPNGSPAFAFHMKNGGINTVPVSQMVSRGGGPLVAAQNTSQVISATDQSQGGGAGAVQGAGPAAQAEPTGQVSGAPTGTAAQPWGPPAAPTGPSQIAQAQPQYPNVSPPAPPPVPGAYNAAAYQMPQGPTVSQNGQVNPALMAGGSDAQAVAAANAQPPVPQITDPTDFNANVKGYSMPDLAKMKTDPSLGDYSGFQWKQDRKDGMKYAVATDPDSPFRELHWKAGFDKWQSTLKENGGLMEQLQQARAKVPLMNGMLSDTQIANMSEDDLKDTLAEAVRLEKTGGDASDQNSLHIRGTINQSQSMGRVISMLEAAKKEGINPRLFSGGAQTSSEEAAKRGETLPVGEYPLTIPEEPINPSNIGALPGIYWDLGWAALHGSRANLTGGQISPLADQMKAEMKYFGEQMQQTPGFNVTTEPKADKPQMRLSGGYQGFGGSADIKVPTDESTLKNINRISQGNSIDDMIAGAKELKQKVDNDIVDSVDRATRLNYRTPPQFKKAVQAIQDGKNIEDNENQFVDKSGNPRMPDHYKNPPGTAPRIPAGGEPNTQVEDEMKRFYGNSNPTMSFDNVDDATKFAKGAKSGTLYDVKDSQGVVHHMRVD